MGAWRRILLLALVAICSCGSEDPVQPNGGNGNPQTGGVVVFSAPPGATIVIDGTASSAITPDTLDLVPGEYHVSVSLADHEALPESVGVDIQIGELDTAQFCLRRVQGTGRIVLLEHFSNISCLPCPAADLVIDDLQEERGYSELVSMSYHTSFPSQQDSMYVLNAQMNDARSLYYGGPPWGIIVIPVAFVDGTLSTQSIDQATLASFFASAESAPPHFSIDLADTLEGNRYGVEATVVSLDCPWDSDLVIQFALLDTLVTLQVPGASGQTEFRNVVRDMLPDASGQAFSPVQGQTLTFHRERVLSESWWDTNEIETVVFVQSVSTKEVFQTASTFNSALVER